MGSYTLNAEILTKFSTNLEKKIASFFKAQIQTKKKNGTTFGIWKPILKSKIVGQNNSS